MSTKRIPLVNGEFYHIYNRGNNKQKIFIDDKDKEHFLKLLYLCNSKNNLNFRDNIVNAKIDALDYERGEPLVFIGAWVLMPNHFHLYITPSLSNPVGLVSNIALYMSKVCNAYSKYFNAKHNRTGSLFEGRFKSVHIKDEVQAKYLFSYIHLNPIKLIQSDWKDKGLSDKKEALNFLKNYKWGSYLDYIGSERKESKIMNRDQFINYFTDSLSFEKEIFEWINYQTP